MAATAAIIAGTIGAIGAFSGASSSRSASRAQQRGVRRARKALRPESVIRVSQKLLPEFRGLIASAAGPQFQQQVNAGLASSGLMDSGYGAVLGAAAQAAPGLMAMQGAFDAAFKLQTARANAALGGASTVQPTQNPWAAALTAGAGAAATAYRGASKPEAPDTTTEDLPDENLLPGGFKSRYQ